MAAHKIGDASSPRRPISQTAPSSRTNTPDARDKSTLSELSSLRSKSPPLPLAIDASDHKPPPHSYSPPGTRNETQHSPTRDSPSPPLIARIGNGSGTHTPAESPAAAALISIVTRSELDNLSRRLEATELSYEESLSEVRQQSSTLEQLKLQLGAIATDTRENKASIAAIMLQLSERQVAPAAQNEVLERNIEALGVESSEQAESMERQSIAAQIRSLSLLVAGLEQSLRAFYGARIPDPLYPAPNADAAASFTSQLEPPQPPSSALQKDGSSSFSCCCGPCWASLLGSSTYQQHNDEE